MYTLPDSSNVMRKSIDHPEQDVEEFIRWLGEQPRHDPFASLRDRSKRRWRRGVATVAAIVMLAMSFPLGQTLPEGRIRQMLGHLSAALPLPSHDDEAQPDAAPSDRLNFGAATLNTRDDGRSLAQTSDSNGDDLDR